jgi:hypothetical protein
MRQGHERVGFREIGADAAARDIVRDDAETLHDPDGLSVHSGCQIDEIVLGQTEVGYVGLVHEHHHARALHPSETISVAVDGGVELAVAA